MFFWLWALKYFYTTFWIRIKLHKLYYISYVNKIYVYSVCILSIK